MGTETDRAGDNMTDQERFEATCKLALVAGLKPMREAARGMDQFGDGIYWDEANKRTRMVLGSKTHRTRVRLHYGDDKPGDGFVFDPFHCVEDLERVEKAMNIRSLSLEERAVVCLCQLDE